MDFAPAWPQGLFDRQDPGDDANFYSAPRFVTHIDARAVDAVRTLYDELAVPVGRVLDLMSSWVSHLSRRPDGGLVVLGINEAELAANPMASEYVHRDLNRDAELPFPAAAFDAVTCCVSIDYLIHPVEVVREAVRVLRPGGVLVLTVSNRCFPSKAVRGWLETDDATHLTIVRAYIEQAGGFGRVWAQQRTPADAAGDPLYGVWATALG